MTLEHANKVVIPLPTNRLSRLDDLLIGSDSAADGGQAYVSRLLAELAEVPIMTIEAAEWHGDTTGAQAANVSPASEIGRAIREMVSAAGRSSTSGTVYRMVLPAELAKGVSNGTLRPLQQAAGNGLRSAIVDGGGKIRGHAAFLPVSLNRGAVVASVGLTFGMAVLTAALEYQARKDEMARLDRIESTVRQIRQEQVDDLVAELRACWRLVREAAAVLVDGRSLGQPNGINAAAFHARKIFEKTVTKVNRIAALGEKLEATPTPDHLTKELEELGLDSRQLFTELELIFSALQLERARILLVADDSIRQSSDPSADRVMSLLRQGLSEVMAAEDKLETLATTLDGLMLKMPDGLLSGWWSNGKTEDAIRDQHLLHLAANEIHRALSPTSEKPLAVDLVYAPDGTMTMLDPSWSGAPARS